MDSDNQQSTSQSASALGGLVRDANTCVERLLTLLDEERTALGSGDADQIGRSVNRKVECVNQLEQLDTERARLCRTLSLSHSDIEAYLTQFDADYTSTSWQSLLNKLELCRDANAVNGTLTRVRREHIEKALQILRGGSFDTPALYGPDGLDTVKDVTNLGQA